MSTASTTTSTTSITSTTSTAPRSDPASQVERLPLGQTPRPGQQAAGGTGRSTHLYRRLPGGQGGAGSGPSATARRPRLNVTEDERRCYSRRKLHALSSLRNARLDPTAFGLHKDYRVPGMRGKVYLLEHPGSLIYAFATLAEIETYAAERQTRYTEPPTWNPWRTDPPLGEPRRVDCAWPGCAYDAHCVVERVPLCRPHAMYGERFHLARGG